MKTCDFVNVFLIITLLIYLPIDIISSSISDDNLALTTSIIIGPYPQNIGSDSIEILWETDVKTIRNEVHWGLSPDCGNVTVENNFLKRNLHRVILENLNSSTKYYYKVFSDDIESNVYSFYTSFEQEDTLKFIAYGDSRGVWDNWQNASMVSKSIEQQKPHFVLHTGDLVHNGKNQSQWIDFFTNSEFIHNSTIYPALGNHEYHDLPYFKYFSLPHNELWYSFDNGPAHFVALDSCTGISLKLLQLIWLIRDLKTNNLPFTIVFFHHPLYSSSNHGSTPHLRWLWQPAFERFNVDIVFNGHDHSYERGEVNNVNYIVTGGGGAPLYDVGSNWWTIYSEKTYHYCTVTANQSQLKFQAIKPNGTIFDSFTINKF